MSVINGTKSLKILLPSKLISFNPEGSTPEVYYSLLDGYIASLSYKVKAKVNLKAFKLIK